MRTVTNKLPLLRGITAGATFAYQRGRQVAVEEFLSDVYALAGSLPDRRYVLNVCEDRYHFMVGFGAALLREQVSLLPPNQTPDLITKLGATYDGSMNSRSRKRAFVTYNVAKDDTFATKFNKWAKQRHGTV